MMTIPIVNIPNQVFTTKLDNNIYNIRIQEANGIMAISIIRNGVPIVSSQRAVSGFPVIPYKYLTDGNLLFDTMNDDYPYYTQFGITQFLLFASASEIEALNV